MPIGGTPCWVCALWRRDLPGRERSIAGGPVRTQPPQWRAGPSPCFGLRLGDRLLAQNSPPRFLARPDLALILSRNQQAAFNSAAVTRAFHARTGYTRMGQRLWTDAEVAALRLLYPDRSTCQAAIPLRTWKAIRGKAFNLGLSPRRRIWQLHEEQLIRRDYPSQMSVRDIAAAVEKREQQVWAKASAKRLRRPRRRPLPARDPLVDAVRQRAFDLGITLADLDRDLGHGSRFLVRRAARNNRQIVAAVRILGGRIVARVP